MADGDGSDEGEGEGRRDPAAKRPRLSTTTSPPLFKRSASPEAKLKADEEKHRELTRDFAQWSRDDLEREVRRLRGLVPPMLVYPDGSLPSSSSLSFSSASSSLSSASAPSSKTVNVTLNRKGQPQRPFDMSKYATRRVAFRVSYFGWDYGGLEAQEHTEMTIETQFFIALQRSRLVVDRDSCGYSRCGRTDKGVSAFGQVLALDVRSNALAGQPLPGRADELDYTTILNRSLPTDIRVLSHAFVSETFSARFDCRSRTYKYFICTDGLDIASMTSMARDFEGTHDFRHVCKINKSKPDAHCIRTVYSVTLEPLESTAHIDPRFRMSVLTVKGVGFLWHQIRHMVALLLFVGKGHEKPDIVRRLLDVDNVRVKPVYEMASELPLVLYDCEFPGVDFEYSKEAMIRLHRVLSEQHADRAIKMHMTESLLALIDAAPIIDDVDDNGKSRQPKRKRNTNDVIDDKGTQMAVDSSTTEASSSSTSSSSSWGDARRQLSTDVLRRSSSHTPLLGPL